MTYSLTKLFTISNLLSSWKQVQEKLRYAPFRDIVDYRDYHFFIDRKIRRLRYDILSIKYWPTYSVRVRSQKSKGMNRVLTYFHPADLVIYNLLCQMIHKSAKSGYFKNAYFSRALSQKRQNYVIRTLGLFEQEPYGGSFKEWKRFSKHRAQLGSGGKAKYAVFTDLANYFDTIHHHTVRDAVFPLIRNSEIVNLLLMFLEHQILRPKYSSHLKLGLPQDSFDCSRVIANLLLKKIDKILETQTHSEWVRWMDDITFCVNEEHEAHRLLKSISETLREDGLTLNSGKTHIYKRGKLKTQLLIVENALLDRLWVNINNGRIISSQKSMRSLWDKMYKNRESIYWDKVIGRIFIMAGVLKDTYLIPYCYDLLIAYPRLHQNIFGYFETINYDARIMNIILKYIKSGYDLYEEVRVKTLESLTILKLPKRDRSIALRIAWNTFERRQYMDQDYSRAASLLVLATYGNKRTYQKLLKVYKGQEFGNYSHVIRRYLAGILLAGESEFHDRVISDMTYETGDLIKDLILFAMQSKLRGQWDVKTKSAFEAIKIGFASDKAIGIRKVLLLGILTHHPDKRMRKQLLDIAEANLDAIGVNAPRKNSRTDELLFYMIKKRS